MSFRESVTKLAAKTEKVTVDGVPFELKKIATGEALTMDGLDEKDPNTAIKMIRAGVVIDDEISDEEILQLLPAETLRNLTQEIMAFNNLKSDNAQIAIDQAMDNFKEEAKGK